MKESDGKFARQRRRAFDSFQSTPLQYVDVQFNQHPFNIESALRAASQPALTIYYIAVELSSDKLTENG